MRPFFFLKPESFNLGDFRRTVGRYVITTLENVARHSRRYLFFLLDYMQEHIRIGKLEKLEPVFGEVIDLAT